MAAQKEKFQTWKRDSAKRKRGVVLTPGIADAVRKGTTEKIRSGRKAANPCVPQGASNRRRPGKPGNLNSDWEAATERNHMGEIQPVEMSGTPTSGLQGLYLTARVHSEMAHATLVNRSTF